MVRKSISKYEKAHDQINYQAPNRFCAIGTGNTKTRHRILSDFKEIKCLFYKINIMSFQGRGGTRSKEEREKAADIIWHLYTAVLKKNKTKPSNSKMRKDIPGKRDYCLCKGRDMGRQEKSPFEGTTESIWGSYLQ